MTRVNGSIPRLILLVLITTACVLGVDAPTASRPVTASAASASQPTTSPSAATGAVGKLEGFVLSPASYPEGVSDEPGYAKYLAVRTVALEGDAAGSVSPVTRAQLLLALANHMLAAESDAAATALLLGQATDAQIRRLHGLAEGALERIDAAKKRLDEVTDAQDPDAASAGAVDELRSAASTLDGLARVISAVTAAPGPDRARGVKRAVVRLAGILESENQEAEAAARLWQAISLDAIDDTDATLAALDFALARPKSLPYDFFGRLLRCRTLARRGAHDVAIGLALQIEERCGDWFRDPASAGEARRTASVVRAAITRELAESYRQAGKEALAVRADALAAHRQADGDGMATLYRCSPVVPELVAPPVGGLVAFFSLTAYSGSVVLVLDRPTTISDDFPALIREAKRFVDTLNEEQEFQVFLLGPDGVEQVGDGNLLAATQANRQRARDLLEAAAPVDDPRAGSALEKAFSLEPDRVFLFAATAVDEGVAKRAKAWNPDAQTAVDVIGLEGAADAGTLGQFASEHRGRVRMIQTPLGGAETRIPAGETDP